MCKFENHKIDTDIHSLCRLSENQLSVTSQQQDAYQLSAIVKVSDSNRAILILICCLFWMFSVAKSIFGSIQILF